MATGAALLCTGQEGIYRLLRIWSNPASRHGSRCFCFHRVILILSPVLRVCVRLSGSSGSAHFYIFIVLSAGRVVSCFVFFFFCQGATRDGPTRTTSTERRCTVPRPQETWGERGTPPSNQIQSVDIDSIKKTQYWWPSSCVFGVFFFNCNCVLCIVCCVLCVFDSRLYRQ